MSERVPVHCTVNSDGVESFAARYFSTTDELLKECRRIILRYSELQRCVRFHTVNARHVTALLALHRLGEIELSIERDVGGRIDQFHVDVKGDIVEPWPDEFFEIEFYLRFTRANESA